MAVLSVIACSRRAPFLSLVDQPGRPAVPRIEFLQMNNAPAAPRRPLAVVGGNEVRKEGT